MHRRQLLERIVELCNDRAVERVEFMWVRAHRGVYGNHYADTIANAYLATQPRDLPQLVEEYSGGLHDQRGTRMFYQVPERGERGRVWQAYPGDRNPLRMSRSRLAAWSTRRLAGETPGSPCHTGVNGFPVMDWDAVCEGAPSSVWAALARAPERWRGFSGGARRATDIGAIMMVRANMMGLPADYCNT